MNLSAQIINILSSEKLTSDEKKEKIYNLLLLNQDQFIKHKIEENISQNEENIKKSRWFCFFLIVISSAPLILN